MDSYTDDQMKLNNYIEGALMAALAVMIALIGIYIPPLQAITSFVWLVPIVVVSVRRGFYTGVLTMITTAVLLMILATPWRGFIYLVQFAGLGIVFAYYFSKKAEFTKIMMMGTVVAAISAVVTFILTFLVMGISISDLAEQFKETSESTLLMYKEMGLLDNILYQQGMTIEQLIEHFNSLLITLAQLIPSIMVVYGMMVAFISYFITRKILQKLKLEVSELPMFRNWQIPWYFIWGVTVGLSFMLYGSFADWSTGEIIGLNIMYMFAPILLIQGLSVFVFYYHKWELSILVKVFLLIISIYFIPYVVMILLITGLFDPLFNYRRLETKH